MVNIAEGMAGNLFHEATADFKIMIVDFILFLFIELVYWVKFESQLNAKYIFVNLMFFIMHKLNAILYFFEGLIKKRYD